MGVVVRLDVGCDSEVSLSRVQAGGSGSRPPRCDERSAGDPKRPWRP